MRVLLVQPSPDRPGGGNAVACWIVQALRDEHELTGLTWTKVDWEAANRFWGTDIRPDDLAQVRVPVWIRALVRVLPVPVGLLRLCIMLRIAKDMGADFDCVVTANNEGDFGRIAVQYVHYPWNAFPRPKVEVRWYHWRLLLEPYYWLCRKIAGYEAHRARSNVTLVNSNWTRQLALRHGQLPSRIVYPPVKVSAAPRPWAEREDGFVCIGRISPEKNLERVIDVLAQVHAAVPGVRLHIVGTPHAPAYFRRIERRIRSCAWIRLHESPSRAAMEALISRQRYGIHGMREEHFGMAPAEMVRAGCIVWVPNGGGQTEIVDHPSLVFDGVADAAAKIIRTLRDPAEQERLRHHLAARAKAFLPEVFIESVRAAVAEADAANQSDARRLPPAEIG